MNRTEVLKIMAVLKTAYPDYHKDMNDGDRNAVVSLWAELLEPFSYEQCDKAVKKLIIESPYVPKINDIVKRIEPINALPKHDMDFSDWEARSHINFHKELGVYIPPETVSQIRKFYPNFTPDPNIKPLAERMAEKGVDSLEEYARLADCN